MRKIVVIAVIVFYSLSVNAQKMWLDLGLKGGYNSTWLLNRNLLNDKYVVTQIMGAPFGGVKLGFNITEKHAICAEFLYTPINERFNSQLPKDGTNVNWEHDIQLQYFSIPVIYKCSKNGSYAEIGMQYSTLKSASESFTTTPASNSDFKLSDAKANFQKDNVSILFGFGAYIFALNENIYVTIGFRGAYGLTDITGDARKGQKYTAVMPSTNNGTPATPVQKSYESTNTLMLGFHLGVDFDFGYLVSAHCGRKQFLFFD